MTEVDRLGLFTIAPSSPYGDFEFHALPDSLFADSLSVSQLISDTILNNNFTVTNDGLVFIINTSLCICLNEDADTTIDGLQVPISNGVLEELNSINLHFRYCNYSCKQPLWFC
ncbi:MAG: hypothetical protein R2764_12825 [Bacteroidales bacterium]